MSDQAKRKTNTPTVSQAALDREARRRQDRRDRLDRLATALRISLAPMDVRYALEPGLPPFDDPEERF